MLFSIKSVTKTRLADTDTPVSLYLRLRDQFAETLLLEHSDNIVTPGKSYICCQPFASAVLNEEILSLKYPDGSLQTHPICKDTPVIELLEEFLNSFSFEEACSNLHVDGFFGYFNYDSIQYFEKLSIKEGAIGDEVIPDIRLTLYKYLIVFNHQKHEITLLELYSRDECPLGFTEVEMAIRTQHVSDYPFRKISEEHSNFSDEEFLDVVKKGRAHCFRGDVFQIVLSREFEVGYTGDDFQVYRALRSINPSQYLFYFDYCSYRLFGSSPEAQLKIENGNATLHPIAGTYKRTGDESKDEMLAELLLKDQKEQAEHVMLVDLARNDLSKTYGRVEVPVFKKVQAYSHVMHIVSEVTGANPIAELSPLRVLANTFPAGTLSGAPKYRAMQLIDEYENKKRRFYGGSIGFLGVEGNCNQAIMIRSFLSMNGRLCYRAGAGVVAASRPENELAEVNNKVAALRKAINIANEKQDENPDH